jgi:arylsulfatase A-like enzyme
MPHEGIGPYGKSDRDKYDAEVTFVDKHIGKLLEFVATKSWAPRTIIIVTSDHGEAFGEHDMTRHGFEIWENLVRVPLFVVAPGAQPRRIDALRSDIDLGPTILDFFGLPPEASFEGKSIVKEIYGAPAEERDVIVDLPMTSDNDRRRALVHGTQKLLCFGSDTYCKLYDLAADPEEKSPVMKGDQWQAMMDRYKEYTKGVHEVPPFSCLIGCLNKGYLRKN